MTWTTVGLPWPGPDTESHMCLSSHFQSAPTTPPGRQPPGLVSGNLVDQNGHISPRILCNKDINNNNNTAVTSTYTHPYHA